MRQRHNKRLTAEHNDTRTAVAVTVWGIHHGLFVDSITVASRDVTIAVAPTTVLIHDLLLLPLFQHEVCSEITTHI